MSLTNKDDSIVCIIPLAITFSAMLNSSGESKFPCLGPNIMRKQHFTIFTVINFRYPLSSWESYTPISSLVKVFLMSKY